MPNWYVGSDNIITLVGLYDRVNAAYENDADTVQGKLRLLGSDTILATVNFSYVAASDGNYRGTLLNADAANLTVDNVYIMTITTTEGSLVMVQKLVGKAIYRSAEDQD